MPEGKRGQLVQHGNTGLRKRSSTDIMSYDPDFLQYQINIEEENGIKDYVEILLRRKWIIFTCLIISVVTVAISSFMAEKTYMASAVIEIAPRINTVTSFKTEEDQSNMINGWEDTRKFYETQYRVLKSRSLGTQVLKDLQNDEFFTKEESKSEGPGFLHNIKASLAGLNPFRADAVEDTDETRLSLKDKQEARKIQEQLRVDAFMSNVKINPDRKSRLVVVNYVSPDPGFSARAVNSLVRQYQEWTLIKRQESSEVAGEFLKTQLEAAKDQVGKNEKKFREYAREVDIVSLEDKQNLIFVQLEQLNAALAEAETQRLEKESLYNEVKDGNYEFLPKIVEDSSIVDLNSKYTEVKADFQNKSVIYGPNFPEIKQLRAQMNKIDADIKERSNEIAQSIKRDYEAALTKENLLRERTIRQNEMASELKDKITEYEILQGEVESSKKFYEDIKDRYNEMKVASALQTTNVKVVDEAAVPRHVYKPNIPVNIALSIFFGLMVGCVLAFGLEHMDSTIRDDEEVRRRFGVPFLGAVPLLSQEEITMDNIEKALFLNPKSHLAESFRVVRTSILYSSPDQPPSTLLLTSTQPLEGKTTSASNLAISMVQSGNRVLILDADLRKPRIHKIFLDNGQGNGNGLSTYLIGKIDYEGLVHRTSIDNLDIIPSGPIPPNPVELIGSKRMVDLLKHLSGQYDRIIVDGPPIANFADSRLLSRLVDGVIIVTSVGITQRNSLRTSIEEVYKVGGRIVGTIVNRVESSNKFGYGYYYYYSNEDSNEEQSRLGSPGA